MNTLLEPAPSRPETCRPVAAVAERYRVAPGSLAENDLVCEHLPLVKAMVGRITLTLPAHVEAEELYSAGLVGLLNAVRHFDPCGGSTFESYARVRIRGAIFDELRRLDWVPRSVHDKARKVQAAIQQLEQQKGEIPAPEEIAKALQLSLPEYEQLLEEIKPATFICLDSVQDQDEGGDTARHESLADPSQPDPADDAAKNELSQLILERLEQLPKMQRQVLALYYFEDLRLKEIAAVFGVTESRICQIHSQAILAIKAFVRRREQDGR